jgi:hypothetical protein
MTYGVAPQRRAVSKKWRGLWLRLILPNSKKCFQKKNKMILESNLTLS